MMELLDREMQRSQRKGSPLSFVIMDIDHFKRVNDQFGHQQGDVVLTTVARLAKQDLRSYDAAARYGGEEFVLILPETPHEGALLVAERLRGMIQQQTFPEPLEELRVTISMGVSTFPGEGVTTIDNLISTADEALYRAKEGGRNRVVSMLEK
jgi:diguanylate cyclase (GGDEF)-like protein